MSTVQSISSLIGEMYDAALDPSLWADVLQNFTRFVGGPGAIYWLDVAEIGAEHHHFARKDHWQKRLSGDASESGPPPRSSGATVTGSIFYYLNAASPMQSLEADLGERTAPLGLSVGSKRCVARFAIHSAAGDDAWIELVRQRLELLLPHMRRALEICRPIALASATVAAVSETLDALDAGVFLLNEHGQAVHSNSSGNAMLGDGRLLRLPRDKPMTNPREEDSHSGNGFAPRNRRETPISPSDGGPPAEMAPAARYISRAFSVEVEAVRHDGGNCHAVAGVIMHEAKLPTDGVIERIARQYRLPGRERQVLEAILDGDGVAQIVERLSISRSTAKTYLNRLFERTGAASPTDLIKLCAAFRSPFSG